MSVGMVEPLRGAGSDLATRVASAAVLAVPALAGAWLGGTTAGLVLAIVAAVVVLEWSRITGDLVGWGLGLALAVAAAVTLAANGLHGIALLFTGLILLVAAVSQNRQWRTAGAAYAALFGLSLIELRLAPGLGLEALIFVLAVTWATDTGAFFVGRLVGGPKLWPSVSPNKTRAGAIGGLATAVVTCLVFAPLAHVPLSVPLVAVALLLSVACQTGDLFESAVKRRFGVKNSSRLVPGHGGLMDRVDGLIFAGGLAVIFGLLNGGPTDLARGLLLW